MMKDVPHSEELVSPGMVNFFYQSADAWLNTSGPIPLEIARPAIEYATTGSDLIMTSSRARVFELTREKNPNPHYCIPSDDADDSKLAASAKPDSDEHTDDHPLDHPEKVVQIYDTYLRNLLATLTAEVDIYVQRALEGQEVPEDYRQSWIGAVGRVSAMVEVLQHAGPISLEGVPRVEIDDFMKERLRLTVVPICPLPKDAATAKGSKESAIKKDRKVPPATKNLIDPDFMLQADLALALSSVLLDKRKTSTAQACNTGQYYENMAETWIEPTVKDSSLDEAQEQRLKQLVAAVAARVTQSCSLTAEND
jgi:hypothetical protein